MKKIHTLFYETNYRKVFLVLLFMYTGHAYTQTEASVIQQRFETFNNNNYQEKVFLHTDKTVYASGEVLWFKAYVTNAVSNRPSLLSKICYAEIISTDRKSLLQGKIEIDSGKGNVSFLIPSSVRTGNYILRAYTNWMKNFDPQFYFEQEISIINPNKKPEGNIDTTTKNYIQFFPEGGNLVYGLNNTVAYKDFSVDFIEM